jgi:hypothetical protein
MRRHIVRHSELVPPRRQIADRLCVTMLENELLAVPAPLLLYYVECGAAKWSNAKAGLGVSESGNAPL